MVQGKTATEVEQLLGPPDEKKAMRSMGEWWIWHKYTFLEGRDYPVHEQGKVVDLEVTLDVEGSILRVTNPHAVDYSSPAQAK